MASCYNFKLMFFLYAMISCKHSITSAASSTSGSTTISTSVLTQSTSYFPTSSAIDTISTPHPTSISPSTLPTKTATSTSVSTTLSPSVSTTTSSPTSSPQTATSTSEPTTSTSSASSRQISSTSETTKIYSPILTPASTSSSDTTAFSSSTSLTTTCTTTSESTTLSLSASTTTTPSSSSETIKFSSLSSLPTTTTSTSDTTELSSSTSLETISTLMSDSTTIYLSALTTTISSSTSEETISSPTSEITTPSSSTSHATTATSTFKSTRISPSRFQSTTMSVPPKSIVVDLGSHTLGLNFSIRVNLTFMDEYKNKTSPGFAKLAADFTEQLTPIYKKTPGLKYIQINEFRNGSVDAKYTVIVSASTSLTEIMDHINRNVIVKLWNMSINGSDVDNTYINQTMAEELDALKSLRICEHSTPRPCPYGFTCSKWISGKVLCSDRCDSHVCVHGACYLDHQNEILPKCRCPINDDGYVYSGDRCEHKSLSTLIITTSAVVGVVLISAFFIVCLICIKMRRNEEQQDNIPLVNLPNYSKYFHCDSTYQPQYGYDLPRGRIKSIESRDWEVIPRYIPDRDDGQQFEIRRPQFS